MKFLSKVKANKERKAVIRGATPTQSTVARDYHHNGATLAHPLLVGFHLKGVVLWAFTLGWIVSGSIVLAAEPNMVSNAPWWKIGRALIEWRTSAPASNVPAKPIPFVKLSLRNEGQAGAVNVQIVGRWVAQSDPSMKPVLLGNYVREVTLTHTAIIDTSLMPLASKSPPTGKIFLEITIVTGGKESDRKLIPWN